jgi:hypothetical protein
LSTKAIAESVNVMAQTISRSLLSAFTAAPEATKAAPAT